MSRSPQASAAIFSQVDVSAASISNSNCEPETEQTELLREVLAAQDRTNEILEELVSLMANSHKQRSHELHQWKNANPALAKSCHDAAESLGRVQMEYLERMTDEINDSADDLIEGEFFLNEFVDRFGPRLAHLNGVIQVLAHLGNNTNTLQGQS